MPENQIPHVWLEGVFQKIFTELKSLGRPFDYIGLSLSSDNFSRGAGWLSYRFVRDFTLHDFWSTMKSITQSNREFRLDNTFTLAVTVVEAPQGNGLKNPKLKRSFVTNICNDDNLCLPRSLAVGLAFLEKESKEKTAESIREWKKMVNNMTYQKEKALNLMSEAGLTHEIDNDGCNMSHIRQFQTVLARKSIAIVIYENSKFARGTDGIIFNGNNLDADGRYRYENNLYLMYYPSERHFNFITNIRAASGCKNFCMPCNKKFRWNESHLCKARCDMCLSNPPCRDESSIKCASCNRTFKSVICFEQHKKIGSYSEKKAICDIVKICDECHRVYNCSKSKHLCGFSYCKACKKRHRKNQYCYIQPINNNNNKATTSTSTSDREFPTSRYIFYDFETRQDEQHADNPSLLIHIPNLCVAQQVCDYCLKYDIEDSNDEDNNDTFCRYCGAREFVFREEPVKNLIDLAYRSKTQFKKTICIAHNSKAFDAQFILKEFFNKNTNEIPEVILNGRNILLLSVGNTKFIDSLNYFQMKLSALPKAFGLPEDCEKGHFPHLFNTLANTNYDGPIPDKKYYSPDTMSPSEKEHFEKWYAENIDKKFIMETEIVKYCKMDVNILRKACIVFRNIFMNCANVCPFTEACTIASACSVVFRKQFLARDTIGIIPHNGYRRADNQSEKAIEWLLWCERVNGREIFHAGRCREYVLNYGYRVDGFLEPSIDEPSSARFKGTVFEFQGCYTHGCLRCFQTDRDKKNKYNRTFNEAYSKTVEKVRHMREMGYAVIEMWECDFDRFKCVDRDFQEFIKNHPLSSRHKINPRDAFYGGRVENFVTEYKVKADEKIRYIDVCSLYPYICKVGKVPIGHPKIHVGSQCMDLIGPSFEKIQNIDGLIKCKILPPRNLYIPVLPARIQKKLMFPLCRSCCEEANQEECYHENASDRELTGTWVMDEVVVALKKGYKLLEIYVIWEYDVEKWNRESNSGGLFVEYVNTFLKIKQEASGWPERVDTEEEKRNYIEEYRRTEGIALDYDKINRNSGLRSVAKLCLNSFWGKFGQRVNLPKTEIIKERAPMLAILSDKEKEVVDLLTVDEDVVILNWRFNDEADMPKENVNVAVAAFVTAQARLVLFEYLDKLGRNALYCDTDGIIYLETGDSNEYRPSLGNNLGQMTNELTGYGPEAYIKHFLSGAPKFYAYRGANSNGEEFECCKVKGIRLTYENSKKINFDSIAQLIKGEIADIKLHFTGIRKTKLHDVVTARESKTCSIKLTKRRYSSDGSYSLPFGFKVSRDT